MLNIEDDNRHVGGGVLRSNSKTNIVVGANTQAAPRKNSSKKLDDLSGLISSTNI